MCQCSLKFTNILGIKPPIQGTTWSWIIPNTSPQFMPQRNTDIMRVTSFLVKYINVYSSQIYTTTHKNKLESAQFKSFLPHFGLAMWRWIICTISFPSLYISLENTKQLTEVFKIVFFLYGVMDVPHTTHLVWTGKSGVWGLCWGLAQSTVVFASLHVVS